MESTIVITSGKKFIDIDAYACMYAYQELLQKQGKKVISVSTAEHNASIPERYRKKHFLVDSVQLSDIENKAFVVVDVSDPKHFETFVKEEEIVEVFDHHPGFENFWKEKTTIRAIIEPIGAAATLIFREYKKSGFLQKISPFAAELLTVAIASNTLAFQAQIGKPEDKAAYDELKKYFDCKDTFLAEYFGEVQKNIEENINESLLNDFKSLDIGHETICIAQLEVFDASKIVDEQRKNIQLFLENTKENIAFLNLIEIGGKRNIFFPKNDDSVHCIQTYIPEVNRQPIEGYLTTPFVILRKEILERMYQKQGKPS